MQIFSCTNLQAARQQLACFKASLILLDITLPDGSGLDFLVEVKIDFPDIPVILLTANDTDFDIVSGLELGADDYITKPFSLAVLRARVNTQLRKHPVHNSLAANTFSFIVQEKINIKLNKTVITIFFLFFISINSYSDLF